MLMLPCLSLTLLVVCLPLGRKASATPAVVHSCYSCHSVAAGKRKGQLVVDSRAGLLRGGDTGPALVPGKPDASLIVSALRYHDPDLQMPPDGALSARVVKDFQAWIAMGAPDPRESEGALAQAPKPSESHWAFSAPVDPAEPQTRQTSWASSPLDRFVLASLEANKLGPSPKAYRRTLIRRATFDLIGLPPTATEIAAFVADRAPDAFAHVIDRLLASPHYGERWGRHWLDVARYADTRDYAFQAELRLPFAYTYRDWVIRAFNEDLPYDQFITQQLAADLMPQAGTDVAPLAALGFLTVGRRFSGKDPDIIDDRIDVVTRGFLGLSVACARCHDHKFDPIPTRDYYGLYGIFSSTTEPEELPVLVPASDSTDRVAYETARAAIGAEITRFLSSRQKRAQQTLRRPEEIAAYVRAVSDTAAMGRGAADGYLEDRGLSRVVLETARCRNSGALKRHICVCLDGRLRRRSALPPRGSSGANTSRSGQPPKSGKPTPRRC